MAAEGLRGGLGEPYCSEGCYKQAGLAIFQADREHWSGPCGACQKPVVAGSGPRVGIVPYNQQTLYLCGDDECIRRARELVSRSTTCVMCGTPVG